jgi:hypothetical protein
MSTELYIPPVRPKPKRYNPANGQFLKGHEPTNKGKRWDEYTSKSAQRRSAKGWVNLDKYRPTSRPDTAGRCRKPIVALTDDGKFRVFKDSPSAAEWLKRYTGESCNRENIGRCCRQNYEKKPLSRPWGKRNGKEADKEPNTDHRYKGVRWYYESDATWMAKYKSEQ